MNLSTNNSRPTVLHHLNARDIVLVLPFLLLQIYPYHGMRFVSKKAQAVQTIQSVGHTSPRSWLLLEIVTIISP